MEALLGTIRLETFRIAILRWERLLKADSADRLRREFTDSRASIEEHLGRLKALRHPDDTSAMKLDAALGDYLRIVETELHQNVPLIPGGPDPADNTLQSQRLRIFGIIDEIEKLNGENFEAHRSGISQAVDDLQSDLWSTLLTALVTGLLIAGGSVFRISLLEKWATEQQAATKEAESQLRHLSQQLVSSQEQERKALSRELHDEIGQVLTALRIELGNLERARSAPDGAFSEHLEETKALAENALRSARAIAMGLRPAMLDELGLGPALEWQARDFSRRTGAAVQLELQGDLADLPDRHRTYLYRIVQEGLTNCARHAQAKNIWVRVREAHDQLAVTVEDDGVGFRESDRTAHGLGLLGMTERVRELAGQISIDSEPGKGTRVSVVLPRAAAPQTSAGSATSLAVK
jgi:signal transduction histidine kinase